MKGRAIRLIAGSLSKENAVQIALKMLGIDGGPGSGNFGHKGRPGQVGGSGPGGGGGNSSGSKSNKNLAVLREGSSEYEHLSDLPKEEAENFDIWKFVEEENKRQEEEKKKKEGEFTEAAERSKESLKESYHMKALVEAAKTAEGDYHKFVDLLTGPQADILREQYKKTGSSERFPDYVKRLQKMLSEEPDMPDPVNKVVDGKDISETYEYKSEHDPYYGSTGTDRIDSYIEDVIHQQGFDGIPRVVSKDEFDRIAKEHPEMPLLYRSFTAKDEETLEQYNKQLEGGFWYVDCGVGGDQYGQGMYAVGVFTVEPATLDMVHEAFGSYPVDVLIDNSGNYWDLGTPQDMDEIDPDVWFEVGGTYLFANNFENEGHLLELVDMTDEGFGKQWVDRVTGEMHDYDWIKGQSGFTEMRECEQISEEQAKERDLTGAMKEMRHYRGGAEHASTREMTLDPSAKIISYQEALNLVEGGFTKHELKALFRKELDDFRKTLDEKYGPEDSPQKVIEEYAFKGGFDLIEPEDGQRYMKACEEVSDFERERLLQEGHNADRRAYGKVELETAELRRKRKEKFKRLGGDVGVCMAALGYDAINAEGHGLTDSYMVILNRTKIIMSDQEVDPYH